MNRDTPIRRRTVLRTVGAVASSVALSQSATAQKSAYAEWLSDVGNFTGTVDLRGQESVTIDVGVEANGGPFGFGPAAVQFDPGTTVRFNWVSDNHNVVLEDGPADTQFDGHTPIENTGFSFEYTFETTGVYLYYCEPHLALGMKGGIVIGNDVPEISDGQPSGDGEGSQFAPPGGETGTVMALIFMGAVGLSALLVLANEFYQSTRREPSAVEHVDEPKIIREIDHDEFDPVGTAALIVLYVLILLVMWVFVYFVEFLGRGPTVIG